MLGKLLSTVTERIAEEAVQLPAVPLKVANAAIKGAERGMRKVEEER